MPEEVLKRTNVRLPGRLHDQLKMASARRRQTIEEIVRKAVERELGAAENVSVSAAANQRFVLQEIEDELRHLLDKRLLEKIRRALALPVEDDRGVLGDTAARFFECLPAPAFIENTDSDPVWQNRASAETFGEQPKFKGPWAADEEVQYRPSKIPVSSGGSGRFNVLRFQFVSSNSETYIGYVMFSAGAHEAAGEGEVLLKVRPPESAATCSPDTISLLGEFLRQLPLLASIRDLELRTVWSNPAYAAAWGRTPEELQGLRTEEISPDRELDPGVQHHKKRAIEEKTGVFASEFANEFQYRVLRFPLLDSEENVTYLGAISTDPPRLVQAMPSGGSLEIIEEHT